MGQTPDIPGWNNSKKGKENRTNLDILTFLLTHTGAERPEVNIFL